ncbi:glutathione S-transferase N-terminal domain-containing protein [Candidatus Synchoanobacter obligatus]|uniref:Glutathione S-transferase N-terminal domain-containing protein n=1 Tax=Candidatus Synchoanobacter obligatus TaxID=2919597 RepID=A0ABT1L4J3_9GAMM|nr:glutathione S-transferase N-terminal domain-containing protein [Candidatus Synchoanobacter obligatus]MCP8351876.1 glutathione S-transferase N-terminal domain-containing protein [Candidatus Synchoanobacter obligatus]
MALLYTFRRCPYAIRARLALALVWMEVEQVQVDLKDKPESMLLVSPKGTVPVLVLDDGSVIDESMDIVYWVFGQQMPDQWVVLSQEEEQMAASLLDRLHQVMIPALNRYKYASRYEDVDLVVEGEHIRGYLKVLEQQLINHGGLVGTGYSWLDVAVLPFVRQVGITDSGLLAESPLVGAWLETWLEDPCFIAVMQKGV